MSAVGHSHPFEEASFGVSCSSALTATERNTTSRRAPTRATSMRTGRPADDDTCRPTCSPDATDCGQQYPVTASRAISDPIWATSRAASKGRLPLLSPALPTCQCLRGIDYFPHLDDEIVPESKQHVVLAVVVVPIDPKCCSVVMSRHEFAFGHQMMNGDVTRARFEAFPAVAAEPWNPVPSIERSVEPERQCSRLRDPPLHVSRHQRPHGGAVVIHQGSEELGHSLFSSLGRHVEW